MTVYLWRSGAIGGWSHSLDHGSYIYRYNAEWEESHVVAKVGDEDWTRFGSEHDWQQDEKGAIITQ